MQQLVSLRLSEKKSHPGNPVGWQSNYCFPLPCSIPEKLFKNELFHDDISGLPTSHFSLCSYSRLGDSFWWRPDRNRRERHQRVRGSKAEDQLGQSSLQVCAIEVLIRVISELLMFLHMRCVRVIFYIHQQLKKLLLKKCLRRC